MFTVRLKAIAAAVAIAVVSMAVPSAGKATTFNPAGGGDPIFAYIISTNEVLALVGVHAVEDTFVDLDLVKSTISSGASQVTNIYFGPNADAWKNPTLNFLNANAGGTVGTPDAVNPDRVFDALWIAVSGELFASGTPVDIVFTKPGGGTNTLSFESFSGKTGYLIVDTPTEAPAPIPLPAAGWLLITALGGLAVAARRRRTA